MIARALAALLVLGCEGADCVDAPPVPRAACERATIGVVVHHTPASPCVGACPDDGSRVALLVLEAAEILEPHAIDLEIVGDVEEAYTPVLRDAGEACPAFGGWDDEAPRDGRLHIYAMHSIVAPGVRFEGWTSDGTIALSTDARAAVLAHEVGHVLGEPHVDDPANLMWGGDHPGPVDLERAQADRMRGRACAMFGPSAGPRRL